MAKRFISYFLELIQNALKIWNETFFGGSSKQRDNI